MSTSAVQSGLTLIEMLVVVSIAVTLQSWAAPAFRDLVGSFRTRTATGNLYAGLMVARSEAIKRRSRTVLCKSADGASCSTSGTWSQGWLVFHDSNNNGTVDNGESVILHEGTLPSSMRVSGNSSVSSYVSYTSAGSTAYISGAFQAGTFTICSQSTSAAEMRQIVISSSGRPRTVSTSASQCL